MYNKKKTLFAILLIIISTLSQAQNSGSNSPYTRFGYGDINTNTSSINKSMGGISIGSRTKHNINPGNPASYSSVDTLTFMFDIGAYGKYTTFKSGQQKESAFNGNFDYINLLFPASKNIGISFGINPYSTIGYNFSKTDSIPATQNPLNETYIYNENYEGTGGLNQVYGGISAKIFNQLSLGVNAALIYGNINHYKENVPVSIAGYTSSQKTNLYINDVVFRYGIQYFKTIKNKHDFTIGAIYENKSSVNGDFEFITKGSAISDTINSKYGFDFPAKFGGGIFYTYNKKLSVGIDYSSDKWADAKYYGKTDSLNSTQKIAVGLEYLHNPFSKNFFGKMKYRAGFNASNSYIKTPEELNNYAITFGMGIPMKKTSSFINLGFEYGRKGKNTQNMIQEDYFKISISSTFVERWFMKSMIR